MVLASTSTNKGSRSSTSGPRALDLTLSSSSEEDHGCRYFVLFAWCAFTRPTIAEDRERYCGIKGNPDVRRECE